MPVTLTAGSAGAVISGSGLVLSTATPFATLPSSAARGSTLKSSGIFAFEVNRNIPLFTRCDVGLTNAITPDPTSLLGTVIIDKNGFVYVNGVFIRSAATPSLTSIIVDLDHAIIWFSANTVGWNNGSNNDAPCQPAHYGEGIDISSVISSGMYPFAIVSMQSFVIDPTASASATFNFGATTVSRTLPSCVSTWDTPPGPPVVANKMRINARMSPFRNTFTGLAKPAPLIMQTLPVSAAATSREPNDVAAGRIANTVGVTGTVTEPADVAVGHMTRLLPAGFDDGEVIFVPAEYKFRVPAEPSSPFVIPFEDTVLEVPLLDL